MSERAPAPITVLVVDDERLARQRLVVLLSGEPDMDVVGEAENGLEAIAAITSWRPELVFLDVHMPDLDGLGVVDALAPEEAPEIVFVTGHDAYMERAFEVHAVDYLRKPYSNTRFGSALAHARRRVHARRAEQGRGEPAPASPSPLARYSPVLAALQSVRADSRLAVQDEQTGTWQIIEREAIDRIEAAGPHHVRVHCGGESYVWRRTLTELQQTLDPKVFLRVHRSFLVNAARIRRVKPLQRGEYALILADGTVLDTGRTYRDVVEAFLRGQSLARDA